MLMQHYSNGEACVNEYLIFMEGSLGQIFFLKMHG